MGTMKSETNAQTLEKWVKHWSGVTILNRRMWNDWGIKVDEIFSKFLQLIVDRMKIYYKFFEENLWDNEWGRISNYVKHRREGIIDTFVALFYKGAVRLTIKDGMIWERRRGNKQFALNGKKRWRGKGAHRATGWNRGRVGHKRMGVRS